MERFKIGDEVFFCYRHKIHKGLLHGRYLSLGGGLYSIENHKDGLLVVVSSENIDYYADKLYSKKITYMSMEMYQHILFGNLFSAGRLIKKINNLKRSYDKI